jgi:glycosyl transferase family 25
MSRAITDTRSGTIDEVFPYQVCINLDRRPERWHSMQRKFDRHGIRSVRRFSAIDGDNIKLPPEWIHTPGAYGCLLSHTQVVREAQRLGVPSILIFEDDVVFDTQLENKFRACIGELPSDWDLLFFGALHKDEPIMVSANIARITQANSTFACALNSTMFDAFIELNQKTEEVLDNNSLILQERFKCYCFMPHLAWVETDYSDAQQRLVDHWYLRESLVLFGPEVDRLLSETTIVFAHGSHSGGHDIENLKYLVNYYHNYFSPFLKIVIVEQGAQPTINPKNLPESCKYVFLRDTSPFNRERCFTKGISHADPKRKRIILSDSDIYLETLHIRANLRMCEQYDYVTGFTQVIDLNEEDSRRLRKAKAPQGIDFMKNNSPNRQRQGYCLFLNREAIHIAGRTEESSERIRSLLSLQAPRQNQFFQSPNHALRLQ